MRYTTFQEIFYWFSALFSVNSYSRHNGRFKYMDQIGPFNPIHRIAFIVFYFHEPVTFNKALFMKKVGVALIVYHPYPAAVFRHEHVHITIERVAMVSASDYFRYTLSLAAHVVELGQIVEVVQAIDA